MGISLNTSFKHNWFAKCTTAFPVLFISLQLLILVIAHVIPAFNLENVKNFDRETIRVYDKYWSGLVVLLLLLSWGIFCGVFLNARD